MASWSWLGRHPSCRSKLPRPAETPGCRRLVLWGRNWVLRSGKQELMMHVELFKSQSHHRKEADRGLFPGHLLLCDFKRNLTLKVQYGRNCRLENSPAGCLDQGWYCFSYLVMLFFLPTIILVKEASTTSLNCSCISSSPNGYISEGNISTLSIDFYWISSILEDDENE